MITFDPLEKIVSDPAGALVFLATLKGQAKHSTTYHKGMDLKLLMELEEARLLSIPDLDRNPARPTLLPRNAITLTTEGIHYLREMYKI